MSPSVPAELSWLLNLLQQTARYAQPALEELETTLLPGIMALRPSVRERTARLWNDSLAGCPELLLSAHEGRCLDSDSARPLLWWLTREPRELPRRRYELLTEPIGDRDLIRRRLRKLNRDLAARRLYRDIVAGVWELASGVWERRGRSVATRACVEWRGRVARRQPISELMPPRHPLTRTDSSEADLCGRRSEFSLSPMYFCMSGGHVADLGEQVHIGVAASDLERTRRPRDAEFVAYRLRVLSEPTRVRILIHLLSAPGPVMETSRALRISQPTVSGHLRVLESAGLVLRRQSGGRTVFVGSRKRVERWLEDARGTLARWG